MNYCLIFNGLWVNLDKVLIGPITKVIGNKSAIVLYANCSLIIELEFDIWN